jgi:hypothetical protein
VNEGNLETGIRAIDILKKLMESDDKDTAAEAKAALEKLAESEKAATARRAKNALTPPDPMPAAPAFPNRIQIGGFGPLPVMPGNGNLRITMKNINGVKTVEADEGDRKITIHEDPDKGITVEITETKNGKETTEKFEAKSEEDLKKNHPKAHAEYAKYSKGNAAGIRINVGGIQVGPGVPGVPFGPALPGFRRADDLRLDAAGRLLQTIGNHVANTANDNAITGASNESREAFKKDVVELKNQLAELEKKLQAAIDEENKNQKGQDKPAE